MGSYKDLIVYQRSIDLVVHVYGLLKKFPKEEIFGLSSQLRRAAVSIPSNIAEGAQRGSKKEYVQFLRISFGSCAEIETQLLIALKLGYITQQDYDQVQSEIVEISKMILAMIRRFTSIN